MEQATPAVRNLARLLLALEANQSHNAEEEAAAVLRIFAKLHTHLSQLVGVAGFQALLSRALALAKAEIGWLGAVRVQDDATLEGFSEPALLQTAETVAEGGAVLLVQLFGLLGLFIGEALTLRLVQEVWPEAQWNDRNKGEENSGEEPPE